MSTEDEFSRWLRRPEKSFTENLQFALKAWQSAEFTLTRKYELVLQWLTEVGAAKITKEFPVAEFTELLQLRAQPGLVAQSVKHEFVQMMLQLADNLQVMQNMRVIPELLWRLIEFELLQDLYRSDYDLQTRIYANLFRHYESYLRKFENTIDAPCKLRPANESDYFASVLRSLQDSAKRASDVESYEVCFNAQTLQPLVQVLLVLRSHQLCFFDELLSLELLLTAHYKDLALLERVLSLPMHVLLLTLECAIVNRRGLENFQQLLLQRVFQQLLAKEREKDAARALTIAAYTLEMLRKHDVALNFNIENNQSAMVFLGARLLPYVEQCRQAHLREVLMLLCAALRLNPLIIEQHVFEVTTWMIVAPKASAIEQQLLEEFLILLMEMFRRLSRVEKLIVNLLKALKEWLRKFKLPVHNKIEEKTPKRKSKVVEQGTSKKLKLSVDKKSNVCYTDNTEATESLNYYLKLLFHSQNLTPSSSLTAVTAFSSFPQLQSAWPCATVGVAFSKLITGLVSKPSLVVWKSLLHSLKELLEELSENQPQLDDNAIFHLDLHAALLCQYFAGCRLAEQSDKFCTEITAQQHFTATLLGQFGRFLLSCEHNKRSMNAFLECSYQAANFELLLAYYQPDGGLPKTAVLASAQQLHAFLSTQEWTLLQQRILNFGEPSCKFLLNRLLLQRTQAQALLSHDTNANMRLSLQETLLASHTSGDSEQLSLLLHAPNAKWLIKQLPASEKFEIAKDIIGNCQQLDLLKIFSDDLESVELLALAIYENLFVTFSEASKDSLLASLPCDFTAIRALIGADDDANDAVCAEKLIKTIVAVLQARTADYQLEQLPITDIELAVRALQILPIGQLRRESKCLLFTLHLAFYRDLKASPVTEEAASKAFEIIKDLLHFGQQVPIFRYFSTEPLLKLLPVNSCWELYELIFANIKSEERGADLFLNDLANFLQNEQQSGKLSDGNRRLLLLVIGTLAVISGPAAKRMRKHLDKFLNIFHRYITAYFVDQQKPTKGKKDSKFVEKTLSAFATYVSAVLTKTTCSLPEQGNAVDENFRRICKIYIGYSMDYRNPHAIRLMQVALNQRQQLHLDQDEIEFVLSSYWRQLNLDLKQQQLDNIKTTENVVKMIIGNKTNEDLLLTLKDIGSHLKQSADNELSKDYVNISRLLVLISKCPFSTIKGAIFNEQFKLITSDIVMRLHKDEHQQFSESAQVLSILACQQAIAENKMIPISFDTLDCILAFLVDINIKKFILSDSRDAYFHELHLAMSEVCVSLIKHRHIMLMDRVPQFIHIFKDLVQSLVWYKSERQKDTTLTTKELDDLSKLALKLEALMHIIATHSVGVKRVAPFVLTYIINLMVSNKRPTTLYPRIKTHIESICYDLIGICDHRVGRFILRCSNEAARQVYEVLVNDHNKYHKFKGKV